MVTYRCGDELYHFGVKGMKWGIRHDRDNNQRESIFRRMSRHRKERKEERRRDKYFRQKRNEYLGILATYDYSSTKAGAVGLKKLQDAYNRMAVENDHKADRHFARVEEKYLRASQAYEINRFLKEHDNNYKRVGQILYRKDFKSPTALKKAYIDDWWVHAE